MVVTCFPPKKIYVLHGGKSQIDRSWNHPPGFDQWRRIDHDWGHYNHCNQHIIIGIIIINIIIVVIVVSIIVIIIFFIISIIIDIIITNLYLYIYIYIHVPIPRWSSPLLSTRFLGFPTAPNHCIVGDWPSAALPAAQETWSGLFWQLPTQKSVVWFYPAW